MLYYQKWIAYAVPKENKGLEPIYGPIDEIDQNIYEMKHISGTQLRNKLRSGEEIPSWFTFDEVANELKKSIKKKDGLCIYFVGLSGSGKTTLANSLKIRFKELYPNRPVTILDGDVIRQNLSKGLGFSKEDRSTNVRRIGYVASEIVKHGGIVFCANIAPYEDDRKYNRELVSKVGRYIEIYVKTSLNVCETRDVKGLYKISKKRDN